MPSTKSFVCFEDKTATICASLSLCSGFFKSIPMPQVVFYMTAFEAAHNAPFLAAQQTHLPHIHIRACVCVCADQVLGNFSAGCRCSMSGQISIAIMCAYVEVHMYAVRTFSDKKSERAFRRARCSPHIYIYTMEYENTKANNNVRVAAQCVFLVCAGLFGMNKCNPHRRYEAMGVNATYWCGCLCVCTLWCILTGRRLQCELVGNMCGSQVASAQSICRT